MLDAAPTFPPIRLRYRVDLNYDVRESGCDFIFNVQAARTAQQRIISERLEINQAVAHNGFVDAQTGTRFLRLRADRGPLRVYCETVLELLHHRDAAGSLAEVPIAELPAATLPYLYPSRYCQSDRLLKFACSSSPSASSAR